MSTEQHEEKLEQKSSKSDAAQTSNKAASKGKPKVVKTKSEPASADTYIRGLLGVAALVVIGALLVVIFAYLNGVIVLDQPGATTIEEFTIARSEAYVETDKTAGSLSQLALAQIDDGQYAAAEATIREAFALNWPDEERNQGPLFAYATLALHQGDDELAIERYEEVMSNLRADFDRVFYSDMDPNWAQAFGMHHNYFETAIVLSFLYHDRGDYEKQLEMLDVAAGGMPTNADIFLWRGQAKLAQGDNAGAIEDFNEALRFIPDYEAALQGLEEAGGN